jgi:hypothetical protein
VEGRGAFARVEYSEAAARARAEVDDETVLAQRGNSGLSELAALRNDLRDDLRDRGIMLVDEAQGIDY